MGCLHVTVILLVQILTCALSQNLQDRLNTEQIIEKYGYPSEIHHIITEDNYNITVNRIPRGVTDVTGKRPAVLLMHGLMASATDYINLGPERSLGYILADAGYDVWMGNARGTTWSKSHLTLDPIRDAEQFWDFSWHEIGHYDVPAIIDHILAINGDDSLYYIGHSQGTTDFFVLASTRPEYNDKIRLASLMAPAAIMPHSDGGLIGLLLPYIEELEVLSKAVGLFELPLTAELRDWAFQNCDIPESQDLCVAFLNHIGGAADEPQLNRSILTTLAANSPNSASLKQFFHYGQQIISGGFAQYDYGLEKNLELYGRESPPAYDLDKITAPVAIFYGKNDDVVIDEDIEVLITKLRKVVDIDLIPYDLFNHIDFLYANDVVSLVYNELLDIMSRY